MPQPPVRRLEAERRIKAIEDALRAGYKPPGHTGGGVGAIQAAADALGTITGSALRHSLPGIKKEWGLVPDWSIYRQPAAQVQEIAPAPAPQAGGRSELLAVLRRGPADLTQIAQALKCSRGQALLMIEAAQAEGLNIHEAGEHWSIDAPHPRFNPTDLDYISRDDDTFLFGITSDNHLASKQARHDVLSGLYDIFAEEGVDRAFNGGNYLEGERDFNRFELTVHGLDAQVANLVKYYPRRDGIVTYAVSGDDHEAWWSQKTGLDIGRRVEQDMRAGGRDDWVNAGFIEANFRLVNKASGASSILRIVHPGGGSAYALSYKAQKYVEALEGGNKPAIVSFAHWHKMFFFNYRGVWCMGSGCTKDQDIFMRKQQLEAHVGGLVVKARQDRRTGAIVRCSVDYVRWFDRGYYENDRWSYAGEVKQPARTIGGA